MPHEFTDEEIAEFIAIWARDWDEIITEEQARVEMALIMELYEALTEPLPGEPGYKAERTDSSTIEE